MNSPSACLAAGGGAMPSGARTPPGRRAPGDGDLVIGYGNDLRGDDGVGPRVVEAVAGWNRPGVRTIACQQLGPELAEPISSARRVIFVDAAVGGPGPVQVRPITPRANVDLATHSADPRAILGLAQLVFGRCPPAWWVTIPVPCFDFSEALSGPARAGLADALDQVRRLCDSP